MSPIALFSFTPYSTEKNFGKAINDHCNLVTDPESWICIRDGDMMNLTPDWGAKMYAALEVYGDEYQLFGCWTNRLRAGSSQLWKGMYDEQDMLKHYEQAISRPHGITSVRNIAGLFMLFQKKTFDLVGGFDENTVAFDTNFCKAVRKHKGKIGLINSIYVYHLYRCWSNNPSSDQKHLR